VNKVIALAKRTQGSRHKAIDMSTDLLDWHDEDQTVDLGAEYEALLYGLRLTEGFGLFFAQCSPCGGEKIIERVRQDLTKSIEVLKLNAPVTDGNVFKRIQQFLADHPGTEVLFIQGLELSLIDNEESQNRVGGNGVPPVLINLNQQREGFRDNFQQRLVFMLPDEQMTQLIKQAPDFFDWRSGCLSFA
jgi:hypothetical protein